MIDTILYDAVISLLDYIVTSQFEVIVSIGEDLLSTYDDLSGQRKAYLSFGGRTSEGIKLTEEGALNYYYVRRKLSFTNKGDEGKEDAILLVISPEGIKKCKDIEITNNKLRLDNIVIYFRKR